MTEDVFHEDCLVLEDNGDFYRDYLSTRGRPCYVARGVFAVFLKRLRLPATTQADREILRRYFDRCYEIGERPGRNDDADVVASWEAKESITGAAAPQPQEEKQMVKLFEMVPYVNGRPSPGLLPDDMVATIAAAEEQIAKYKALGIRPKAIDAEIARLEGELTALVAYYDSCRS